VYPSIDLNGTEVVKYVYGFWSRILSTTGSLASTLGTHQPFRYRGYVYAVETGLYYLKSRYYNPVWQRFVNADSILVNNLFAYCCNSPCTHYDPEGKFIADADEYFGSGIMRGIESGFGSYYLSSTTTNNTHDANNPIIPAYPINTEKVTSFVYKNTGPIINSIISGVGDVLGGKIAYSIIIASATAGMPGLIAGGLLGLLVYESISATSVIIGTIVEQDLRPDFRLGNEYDNNSNEMITNIVSSLWETVEKIPGLPSSFSLYDTIVDYVKDYFIKEELQKIF